MAAKKRKTKKQIAGRLKIFAGLLALLVIIAFGTARYFNTTRGRIFLLDIGFDGKYENVRRDIGTGLLEALKQYGIRKDTIEIMPEEKVESGYIYLVKTEVPAGRSLIKINNIIDMKVEEIGGRVRSCYERDSGNRIEMEIGTRTRVTHRCVIAKSAGAVLAPEKGPVVALVVDDFGFFNNRLVRDFLGLDIKITVSVIPGLKYSKDICRLAGKAQKDALCHLPMEPEGGADDCGSIPVVRVSMSDDRIKGIVEDAIANTPGVVGMNNHQGSKATADSRVMKAVLSVCRKHDLFFFDSLTSSESVAAKIAPLMGMPSLRNDIFLDNRGEDARRNMVKIMDIAARRGWALGILHVRRESFKDLLWMEGEAGKRGITFVNLREIPRISKNSQG
ncbi:MAG TPA: divergent polysaccharide deacetylase family protein [Candidatus Krumholzibacteriaceae bacterium]|nr:divergent polysaccharide deacetylase family protein [Candidatus Krumholzibacteriaceae bacterium]